MPAEKIRDLPAEPEREPVRVPVVTPRSAAWLVGQIRNLLPSQPELLRSLADQQRQLQAEGHEPVDAVAHVVRELLAMSAENQPPLDGHDELSRAVRICSQKILTGEWRIEPDPGDMQRQQAERATIFQADRLEEIHQTATVLSSPSGGVKIVDTRDGVS